MRCIVGWIRLVEGRLLSVGLFEGNGAEYSGGYVTYIIIGDSGSVGRYLRTASLLVADGMLWRLMELPQSWDRPVLWHIR